MSDTPYVLSDATHVSPSPISSSIYALSHSISYPMSPSTQPTPASSNIVYAYAISTPFELFMLPHPTSYLYEDDDQVIELIPLFHLSDVLFCG